MTKIKMIVEFEYDDESMHSGDGDEQAKDWFFNDILLGGSGNTLAVSSSEIGDHIGTIKVLSIHDKINTVGPLMTRLTEASA